MNLRAHSSLYICLILLAVAVAAAPEAAAQNGPAAAIALPDVGDRSVNVFNTLRLEIAAQNAHGDVQYSIDPLEGAFIHPASGRLVYVPVAGQEGTQNIRVHATDDNGTASTTIQVTVGAPTATVTGIAGQSDDTYVATVDVGSEDVRVAFIGHAHDDVDTVFFFNELPANSAANQFRSAVIGGEHPKDNILYFFMITPTTSHAENKRIYAQFVPGRDGFEIIPNPYSRPAHYVQNFDITVTAGASVTLTPTLLDSDGNPTAITGVAGATKGEVSTNGTAVTYRAYDQSAANETITYTVTDITGRDVNGTIAVTIEAVQINPPPVIDPIANITVPVGKEISFYVNATDIDTIGNLQYYINHPLPPGVADGRDMIDQNTGHFSWTPDEDQIGVYTLTLLVWDGQPRPHGRTYLNFNITVQENPPPVIKPIDDITVSVGEEISFYVDATDEGTIGGLQYVIDPILSYGAPNGSDILNRTTGYFSWTPSPGQAGIHSITLRVWDGQPDDKGWAHESFTITVQGSILAAVPSHVTIPEHEEYTFVAELAEGAYVPGHTFRLYSHASVSDPTMDPATGRFSWTPSEDHGWKTFTFTIAVLDGSGTRIAVQYMLITVTEHNPPPVIEPIDDIVVSAGQTVSFYVNATDIDTKGSLRYILDRSLPPGVENSSEILDRNTGHFSWAPNENQTGTHTFNLRVWDGQSDNRGQTRHSFNITVIGDNPPPVIKPIDDIVVPVGTTASFYVNATDMATLDNLQYYINHPLPPGVADGRDMIDQNTGHFSWTPDEDQIGVYTLTLLVWDGQPRPHGRTYLNFNITVQNPPPVIEPIDDITVYAGQTVSFQVNATDIETIDRLRYILGSPLPPGVTDGRKLLDQDTGYFKWTPDETGIYHIRVLVWDGQHGYDGNTYQNFTITVLTNPPPVVAPIDDISVSAGQPVSFYVNATDIDTLGSLQYVLLDPLPPGVGDGRDILDRNTGYFSWTPNENQTGVHTVTVRVWDGQPGNNGRSSLSFNITVTKPNQDPVFDMPAAYNATSGERLVILLVATDADIPEQTLTYSIEGEGLGAVITNQTLTWTPEPDHAGEQTLAILVRDSAYPSGSARLTISITVALPGAPQNTPPVASNFGITAAASETVRTDLAEGGHISDGEQNATTLVVTINDIPVQSQGKATASGTAIVYAANDNATGTDTVSYTVTDDGGLATTATMTVTISPKDMTAPVAPDITTNSAEDMEVTVEPEISDPDGGAAAITGVTGGRSGTANHTATTVTYTPNPNFNGNDTVTYTVTDDEGETATGMITINVTPINDPPVLTAIGGRETNALSMLDFAVTATDVDGDMLVFTLFEAPTGAAITPDGRFNWLPAEKDVGRHTVAIGVGDGQGGSDSETFLVNVRPADRLENQNPVIADISLQNATVGQTLTISIDATDPDIPAQTLSYRITGDSLGATISGNVVTWTPNSAHVGNRSITVLVEDDYDPKGSATVVILIAVSPVTQMPGQPGTNRDPAAPDILINAGLSSPSVIEPAVTDPDGDDITITALTEPALGRIDNSSLSSGIIIYTPDRTGIETINYTVTDANRGSDTGTITIFINEAGNARPELATIHDRGARVGENLNFTAVATDEDDTALTFGAVNLPAGATMDVATGSFDWMPTPSQNGSHTVTIFVRDDAGGADWQDVAITVLRADEINLPPVPENVTTDAVIGELKSIRPVITDPENDDTTIIAVSESALGSVTEAFLSRGLVVYLGGELGSEDITYTVSDGRGGIANATISITVVEPANVNPVLDFVGDRVVIAGSNLSFDVTAIDIDGFVSGFELTGTVPTGASISPLGAFNWMPDAGQVGKHDITIIVFDDADSNDTETITVTVRPEGFVNSPPTAPDVIIATSQDIPNIARPVITDPDDDPVIILETGPTAKGKILSGFLRAGIIIYQPDPGQTGTETTRYTAFDGSDGTDTATVTIFINENGNGLPVLESIDHRNINVGQTLTFDVTATDPDGDTLSYLLVGAPENAQISEQGGFSWTPGTADEGNHTITIVAYDDRGGSDAQVASIRVLPAGTANSPPNAPSTSITVAQGAAIVITPEISDPDGDTVLITDAVSDGDGLIISSDDRIDYIHISTAPTETITYTVTDARGATSTGTITITIQ